jgi:L-fuconolactonase
MIVDAHVHLWDLQRAPQPWMRDADHLLEIAAANPWIMAVTAWVALEEPRRAVRRLERLRDHPCVRAVRHLVQEEPDHWLLRPGVLASLEALQQLDLILEVPVVFPRHFDDVAAIAERLPRLRIVIDHLGKPPIGSAEMRAWSAQLARVAAHPTVAAKVSGLNTAVRGPWTLDTIRPPVEDALECFGPQRLLCGSDWPVALLNGSYDEVWRATTRLIELLAPDHAADLLGGNACRLYGPAAAGAAAQAGAP